MIADLQSLVALALGVVALLLQGWALIDALRARPEAFIGAGKRTKGFWLALTAVAALIGFVFVSNPFNLFSLAAVIVAAIYLTDVRPAVKAARGGGHAGPYGPW